MSTRLKSDEKPLDSIRFFLKRCAKFHTSKQKNFYTIKVTEHWNTVPSELVVESPMEMFKTRLDIYPHSLL